MERRHITNRFEFQTICAGILRLIKEPSLFRKYHKYLSPEHFFSYSIDDEHGAFRLLISHLRSLYEDGDGDKFSFNYIQETLHSRLSDSKSAILLRNLFPAWKVNEDILSRVNDDKMFEVFIDYLKAVRIAQMSAPFSDMFQSGKIGEAINCMQLALTDVSDMAKSEKQEFDPSSLFKSFSEVDINAHKKLFLHNGISVIDDHVGGFDAGTLNYFIGYTGGGKSQMCHHLIRKCLESQKYVHVSVVEDREKSFAYRVVAALTGIPIRRLMKEFNLLTQNELKAFNNAIQQMKTYLRVDFIYNQSVDVVHKAVLDKDMECELRGLPKSEVHIVDYTGHISRFSPGERDHTKMRNAYGARKDFALQHSKICFDFAQVNREGHKKKEDKKRDGNALLTLSDLAGSYDIAQVGDNIISINRTDEDISNNTAQLYLCKTRDGRSGSVFRIKSDFETARYDFDSLVWSNGDLPQKEALDSLQNGKK